MSVKDLLTLNRLTLTSLIYPGMRLTVPSTVLPSTVVPKSAPLTYEVRRGDALSAIATRYGVKLSALLAANGLKITSVVHPGRVLTLPAGAVAPVVTPPAPAVAATPSKVDLVLAFAIEQRGKPYRFNAAGPDAFDCSGLVRAAFLKVGISLPHQSLLQSTYGTAVDWTKEPIRAGDLVFTYSTANPTVISHVGIATSATTWIQAPQSNDVVRTGPLPVSSKIVAVRRVIQP
jgi:cell wall-associated NlpC family hydrolase